MRIIPKLIFINLFIMLIFIAVGFSISGELIEPTRTIQKPEKAAGRISVFSEPPGLDVFLNNLMIGKTPILSMVVEQGTYNLKVKDSKKEIYVMPGKSLRLSLYKGHFIEIQEKEIEPPQKSEEKATEKIDTAEPEEKKTEYEPTFEPYYWPMNPSGPIKVKRND